MNMFRKLSQYFIVAGLLSLTSHITADAQEIAKYTLAKAYKSNTKGNPISPWMLCADPTAVEYDGRLYVYGTNDQQELDVTGDKGNNTYGKITQLVCFSTADMVNWTHHGIINVKSICTWCWTSWAPSITSRVESDGKTHFYMYFTNGASGIGVMTATHPLGPWSDPIGKALIDGNTPGRGLQSNIIDPGVCVDSTGTGWLTFGGGDPNRNGNNRIPGNARIVKLGKNMASLASNIVEIKAPYHFEANELNYINGKFLFSYSSNWGTRNDWNNFIPDKAAPGVCTIAYMTSDDPLNSDSWTYQGDILKNPSSYGYPGGNNHSHMQKFGSNWYIIYHTHWIARQAGITGGYRGIAINKFQMNEIKGLIQRPPLSMTDEGAPALPNYIDPFSGWVQAETMSNCAGIRTENYATKGNCVISAIDPGDWIGIRNVDFTSEGADSIQTKTVGGSGQILVFIDNIDTTPEAVVDVALGKPLNKVALNKHYVGRHNVYFVFSAVKNNMRFDYWRMLRTPVVYEDVNGDGLVDTQDVLAVYDRMQTSSTYSSKYDTNRDNVIDTQDILTIYDKIQTNAKKRK